MGSRLRDSGRFFELFCEVSPGDRENKPSIIWKYPDAYSNEDHLDGIPKFAFPGTTENFFVQRYSFVLTSVDSKYTFGFCRFDCKSKTTSVILSYLPWHDIFFKLLNCIASIINSPDKGELRSFLDACYTRPPMVGHTLSVRYNAGQSVLTCPNPGSRLASIPDNFNLTEYFSALDTDCMVGLWAALLHERRVAIVASKASRLSACVQAANATLFPMSWQHIFIPILPIHLVDYLLAPMPYLVGVPKAVMDTVPLADVGEIVLLDADTNQLRSPFRDEQSLPNELVTTLKKALSNKNALGDAVSRAFLQALVRLIGGYRDAIRIEHGQKITFSERDFIKTRKSMQPFLKKILELQIFRQFIEERLELLNSGKGFSDEFEMECCAYADKVNMGNAQRLRQQYRDWAKNVKKEGGAFFKNVKDKANPAVQSAVKSVRQGGKNVKSAVKGFKIKIPNSGSRSSSVNNTEDTGFSGGSDDAEPDGETPRPQAEAARPGPTYEQDLLTELEFDALLERRRRGSLPSATNSAALSAAGDKSKTLSPSVPPRIPERPKPSLRYSIIPIKTLVDFSDAPTPPPRAAAAPKTQGPYFVSEIVRDANGASSFHTSTISFGDFGKDKGMLKLSMSSHVRRPQPLSLPPSDLYGRVAMAPQGSRPAVEVASVPRPGRAAPGPSALINRNAREGSDSDLIKLDDSPKDEFDPLKSKSTDSVQLPKTTDSALLREYGLDFSQFRLSDDVGSSTSSAQKGWATFDPTT